MRVETGSNRLIDSAPRVQCPTCVVQMGLRTLIPVVEATYRAMYRCLSAGRMCNDSSPLPSLLADRSARLPLHGGCDQVQRSSSLSSSPCRRSRSSAIRLGNGSWEAANATLNPAGVVDGGLLC